MLNKHNSGLLKTAIACALFGLAGSAMPAFANGPQTGNPYSPAYGHAYRHGVVPTREAHARMKQFAAAHAASNAAAATGTETLSYGGGVDGIGVTSGAPKVYLVVYGSQWGTAGTDANGNMTLSGDSVGAVPYLESLFKGLGTGGELWSGTMTQYCDGATVANGATSCPSGAPHIGYPTGGAFAGIWYDNSVSSPSSATGAQLAQEAIKAAQHFGNTTAASNRYVQYVILSPSGTHPDGFNTSSGQFCAWHDWNGDQNVSSPVGDVAFTNMPYVYDMGSSCGTGSVNGSSAGKRDGFSIVEGHEYAETVTDQNPAGGWTNHTGSSYNGQENGDECAWISSGQGATANVTMGTGTFPMQSTWSNDTNECDLSHPIVSGGTTNNPPVANFSDSISGLTVNFTDTSTDSDGSISSRSWNFGDGTTSTATNPSHTYSAAGTYSVSLTVTDNGGATNTKTQSVTVSSSGGGNVLQNGVPITNQSGAQGAQLFYTVTVPAGASNLVISESGGSGDADLYTRFGSAPTLSSYDCRPYITGNNESCTVASPQAGTYYVMLNGYAAFSGVSVKATWSTGSGGGGGGNVLQNGVAATGLSASTGNSVAYTMVVPAGATNLSFKIAGSSGDADLYVKFGSAPTTSSYDCRPYLVGDNETCNISNVQAGTYYVMVRAYATYSGVSLTGSYTP
ncbi:MAG TPA: pre-peptidase C-terminal domain-containing protein [Dyella sp.]|nr:pre-peptidase C-terminal domain-containing protein [Dyella sp.]